MMIWNTLWNINWSTSLTALDPFLDEDRQRIQATYNPYDVKHQILIPYDDLYIKFIMSDDPQTLLATTKRRFWLMKQKTIPRFITLNWVQYNRAYPNQVDQLFITLLKHRVQQFSVGSCRSTAVFETNVRRRSIGRRGPPKASIQIMQRISSKPTTRDERSADCSSSAIDFHLIPPQSHFSEIWEAAVKSDIWCRAPYSNTRNWIFY